MGRREKREDIYLFIESYINQHGYGPSVREICESVELKSTATAHYHLRLLAEEGRIRIQSGKKRAISLPRPEDGTEATGGARSGREDRNRKQEKKDEETEITAPEALPLKLPRSYVPLVGSVAAGQPILATENVEAYLPWEGGEGWFALRVKGESMKNVGILPGDKLIVRPQPTAENGEIVVALLGDEATVKRFFRKNGHIWLMPENEAYEPIDGDKAVILGLVRGVVREYL